MIETAHGKLFKATFDFWYEYSTGWKTMDPYAQPWTTTTEEPTTKLEPTTKRGSTAEEVASSEPINTEPAAATTSYFESS